MPCVKPIEAMNGMQYDALLRIVAGKFIIEFHIPSALVAIVPEYDARMIHVTNNHFSHQLLAHLGIISRLPSPQFIENEQSQGITQVQKFRIRWIVRHPHGIHVHVLYECNIVEMNLPAQRTTRLRPKAVAIHSLQDYALAVNVYAITGLHLNGSES